MPKSHIPEDIKAAAHADLYAGESPAVVARKYGISDATVRSWRARMQHDATNATNDATNDATEYHTDTPQPPAMRYSSIEERHARLADLVHELLETKLRASRAISIHVETQTSWVQQQSASDLADLGSYLDQTASNIFAGYVAAAQRRLADSNSEEDT